MGNFDPTKARAHHCKERALHRKHRESVRNEKKITLKYCAERRLKRNDKQKLLARAITLE